MPLSPFHNVVATWFESRFGSPTAPQIQGWPEILAEKHTLIAAPTGSGKTLAAFLCCIDRLVRRGLAGDLPEDNDSVEVLYISPLKALSSDVRRNLEDPLVQLSQTAASMGLLLPPIRVGLRTGDTPAAERQALVKNPPHILVTTPESLYLCLTSKKARKTLSKVRTVIVDEIHAMVQSKRGAHLCLSLCRLDDLVSRAGGTPPTRIGLSATQKPLSEVARFLTGFTKSVEPTPESAQRSFPPCSIIDTGSFRQMDLEIRIPKDELSAVCSTAHWEDVHDQIATLINAHKTTLIFVSTRRLCERVAHSLRSRLSEDAVIAHHGSLSKRLRHSIEERLRAGSLKAVVATASLELGIDIGAVDLVCQIGSPRAIATLLQRVGRANHRPDLVPPRGRLFALTRDDLVECVALLAAIRRGDFDVLSMPKVPLDVLAQQICAICAVESSEGHAVSEDDLFSLLRRAYPFGELTQTDFDRVITMLAEGVALRRGRQGAHLHRDSVARTLRGRKGALLFAVLNGGTIPEPNEFDVVSEPQGTKVGRLDEEWVAEASPGDIFLLGTTSWRLRGVSGGTVFAEDANGAPPTVPFWAGEAPGRTFELSQAVSTLRIELEDRIRKVLVQAAPASTEQDSNQAVPLAALSPVCTWLAEHTGVDDGKPSGPISQQVVGYLAAAQATLGRLPTHKALIAERFFDEAGGMQLVLHMPFGARINRAFGLSLRKKFCRSFNFELQAAATDDGVLLSLGETHSFPIETVWEFVRAGNVEHVLSQAVLGAPVWGPHFRFTAQRALAIPRRRTDKKVPPQIVRMYTEDLTGAIFPAQAACPENLPGGDIEIPDHPIVKETLRECLQDVMDLDGLKNVLSAIEQGAIAVHGLDTPEPSLLTHQLLNAAPYAFLDDIPIEERRARAVTLRRGLPAEIALKEGGRLDRSAIDAVRKEAWPQCRDSEELHDALLTLHYLPGHLMPPSWAELPSVDGPEKALDGLLERGRVCVLTLVEDPAFVAYVPVERAALVRRLFEGAPSYGGHSTPRFAKEPANLPWALQDQEGAEELAAVAVVRGWMMSTGPWTQEGLARALCLPSQIVEAALLRLEGEGQVLRGRFRPRDPAVANWDPSIEWCDRRLLARIHHLTTARLRREIEPVTPALLIQFLTRWQNLHPAAQLAGPSGLRHVLEKLQGFEAGAGAWEELLAQRVKGYEPAWLDDLCLSGELSWGRIRPPLTPFDPPEEARGPSTTRSAPVSLFLRTHEGFFLRPLPPLAENALSPIAKTIQELLKKRGALFLAEIVAHTKQKEELVQDGLSELVARGLCTADGFAGLRKLVGLSQKGRSERGTGRWALLYRQEELPEEGDKDAYLTFWARQYLRRFGVVTRDLLQRETGPTYQEVLPILRILEARGQIRGGRFVAGLYGEQFALPEAVESLRALRRMAEAEGSPLAKEITKEEVEVRAADPLNLVGILTPGPKVPSNTTSKIRYVGGVVQVQTPKEPTKTRAAS